MAYGPQAFAPSAARDGYSFANIVTARSGSRTLVPLGVVIAFLGLVLIFFSWLTWGTTTAQTSQVVGGARTDFYFDVQTPGLGTVPFDTPKLTLNGSHVPLYGLGPDDGALTGTFSGQPGIGSLVAGIVTLLAAAAVAANRFPGVAAAVALAAGLLGSIIGLLGIVSRGFVLGKLPNPDTGVKLHIEFTPGYGAIVSFVAALLLVLAAAFAVSRVLSARQIAAPGALGQPAAVAGTFEEPSGYGQVPYSAAEAQYRPHFGNQVTTAPYQPPQYAPSTHETGPHIAPGAGPDSYLQPSQQPGDDAGPTQFIQR